MPHTSRVCILDLLGNSHYCSERVAGELFKLGRIKPLGKPGLFQMVGEGREWRGTPSGKGPTVLQHVGLRHRRKR